ncbi:MAG: hypothetical protein LBE92_15635 [Chryseobacterium sp.]|uniref:hypothetical protein n=1 Tax=Chryseobacterium sp. TaxID=1871047 RepID=UPI0028305C3B|nr:hypothetical protein [Chryseobacterium sp.]MDR2237552.1 hypothetical protein [Chryseobacterium sp.]
MEKKTLYKLIPLLAPNWKYNREDRTIIALYGRYGIDSLEIESEVKEWKKNLNKKLIDSFSVATFRDSEGGRGNRELILKNDKKNEQLLIWTLKNYGYPSLQKIGLWSNNDEPMSIGTILNHMASYDTYPYFKKELLKYVESGECTPLDYAMMVDKFDMIKGRDCTYCTFKNIPVSDSLKVNINRRKIGMPSLNHSKKIHNDYFKR